MTADEIQTASVTAVGVPEDALRAAVDVTMERCCGAAA
jgi:hypothetical protein